MLRNALYDRNAHKNSELATSQHFEIVHLVDSFYLYHNYFIGINILLWRIPMWVKTKCFNALYFGDIVH